MVEKYNTKEKALKAIQKSGKVYENLPEEMKWDKAFITEAIAANCNVVRYLPEAFYPEKEFYLAAVRSGVNYLYLPECIKEDRAIALEAAKKNGKALKHFPLRFKNDDEIVMEAVKNTWEALEYAGDTTRDNEDIVRSAIKQRAFALKWASKRLKDNEDLVTEAVNKEGGTIDFASPRLKKDKELCLTAVTKDGKAYLYINRSLQTDRDIILAAVKEYGWVLQRVPKSLRDAEICQAAIQNYGAMMFSVPEELRTEELYKESVLCNTHQLSNSFWSLPPEYMNVSLYIQSAKQERLNYATIKDFMKRRQNAPKWDVPERYKILTPLFSPLQGKQYDEIETIYKEFRKNKEVQLLEQFYEYFNHDIASIPWSLNLGPKAQLFPHDLIFVESTRQQLKMLLCLNFDFGILLDRQVLLSEGIYEKFLELLTESEYAGKPLMKAALKQGSKEAIVDTYMNLVWEKLNTPDE